METLAPVLITIYLFSVIFCSVYISKVDSGLKYIPDWVAKIALIVIPVLNTILAGVIIFKLLFKKSNEAE